MQNRTAADMTTAMLLASNVREAMTGLSFRDPYTGTTTFGPETGETLATYNDVDDFDGRSFSPPIDSLRATIPSMSQYTQFVAVMPIYPNKLNANTNETSPEITPKSTYTGAARVRVRILFSANATETPAEVYRANWERVDN
ncbi:MAG: hypothetical protein ACREJC_21940 [Tepidisphaeraceae bacterium]